MWFVIGEKRCTEMNKASLKSLAYFLGHILIQKRGRGKKVFSVAFPLDVRRILVLRVILLFPGLCHLFGIVGAMQRICYLPVLRSLS